MNEEARRRATIDLDLECPPSDIPVGEAIQRLRRRSRLIDSMVMVFIVVTPLSFIAVGVQSYYVNQRADRVAERLVQLEDTNASLRDLVAAFRGLALATTPDERQAALDDIKAVPVPSESTTTVRRSTTTTTRRTTTTSTSSTVRPTPSTTSAPPTTAPSAPQPSPTTTTTACRLGVGGICVPL